LRLSASTLLAVIIAGSGSFLVGCSSPPSSGQALNGQAQPANSCPLTPEDLAKVTSLSWELRERKDDHPLETAESIKATVCLYTAADALQDGSDPLSLRADVVTGPDAATVRTDFTATCSGNGGKVRDSASAEGAVMCDRDGSVVEGAVGSGDRLVSVYLVNADKPTATKLTPAFDHILAAVD
jgi:hypothetical protein